MNPVVSIIVPVYNAKEYLRRCVDSILGQEYTDFELLLIDDGSQDGSVAIAVDSPATGTRRPGGRRTAAPVVAVGAPEARRPSTSVQVRASGGGGR